MATKVLNDSESTVHLRNLDAWKNIPPGVSELSEAEMKTFKGVLEAHGLKVLHVMNDVAEEKKPEEPKQKSQLENLSEKEKSEKSEAEKKPAKKEEKESK